jgi:hypothetical protein
VCNTFLKFFVFFCRSVYFSPNSAGQDISQQIGIKSLTCPNPPSKEKPL